MPLLPLATRSPEPPDGLPPEKRLRARYAPQAASAQPPQAYTIMGPPTIGNCAGSYVLTGELSNGLPVWQCAALGTYIFADTNRGWSVGEGRGCLLSGASLLSSEKAHQGQLPHSIPQWCRGTGTSWIPCHGVAFLPAERPQTHRTGDSAGTSPPGIQLNGTAASDMGSPTLGSRLGARLRGRFSMSAAALTAFGGSQLHGASNHASPKERAGPGVVYDFQVDYPKQGGSLLTRRELGMLKHLYDEHISKLAVCPENPQDLQGLHGVLHSWGIGVGSDVGQVERAVQEARSAVAQGGEQRGQQPLSLSEFIMTCDVLKEAKSSGVPPDVADSDMIEAFVAMGGNRDQTGNISLEFLRQTADVFQLDLQADILSDGDEDGDGVVDFSEFHTILRSSITHPHDAFQLAGGDLMHACTVRFCQLREALLILSEVGCIEFSQGALAALSHRIDDESPMSLMRFTTEVWTVLGLSLEGAQLMDNDALDSIDSASSVTESRSESGAPTGALIAAMITTKKRRQTTKETLHSAALAKRFQHLCRKILTLERRPAEGGEGAKCTLEHLSHTLVLQTEMLRSFVQRQQRLVGDAPAGLRGAVIRAVEDLVTQTDVHDAECPSCILTTPAPKKRAQPSLQPGTAQAHDSFHPVSPLYSPSRTHPGSSNWKLQPAPPTVATVAKVFQRVGHGVVTEEPADPVYVNATGRAVAKPPAGLAKTQPSRQRCSPRAAAPPAAASTCSFLSRGGNRCGVVPSKRIRRKVPPVVQGGLPCPVEGQGGVAVPPREVQQQERSVCLRLKRKGVDAPLGLQLGSGLVLRGVQPGTPASKACCAQLLQWTLTHVDGVMVGTVREAEDAMEGVLSMKLRFNMPVGGGGGHPGGPVAGSGKRAATAGQTMSEYVDMLATTPLDNIPSSILVRLLRRELSGAKGARAAQRHSQKRAPNPRRASRRLLL